MRVLKKGNRRQFQRQKTRDIMALFFKYFTKENDSQFLFKGGSTLLLLIFNDKNNDLFLPPGIKVKTFVRKSNCLNVEGRRIFSQAVSKTSMAILGVEGGRGPESFGLP